MKIRISGIVPEVGNEIVRKFGELPTFDVIVQESIYGLNDLIISTGNISIYNSIDTPVGSDTVKRGVVMGVADAGRFASVFLGEGDYINITIL